MNFEAVPYLFRSSSDGNGEQKEYIGLVIRPSGSTTAPMVPAGGRAVLSTASASGATSLNGKSMIVNGAYPQGAPTRVVVEGGKPPPKMLVPANVKVQLPHPPAPGTAWSASGLKGATFTTSSGQSIFPNTSNLQPLVSTATDGLSSPISPATFNCNGQVYSYPVRSNSVSQMSNPRSQSSRQGVWVAPSDSSSTPDSGIQSVPGTPDTKVLSPQVMEPCSSVEEPSEEAGCEDFADMPRLLPADQDGDMSPCPEDDFSPSSLTVLLPPLPPHPSASAMIHPTTSAGCSRSIVDDSIEGSAHGSECEQPHVSVPSISITHGMDPSEIAEQLLTMDPDKVKTITNLIRQKTKRAVQNDRRSSSRTSANGEREVKRVRPESSASEEMRRSEEEGRSVKIMDCGSSPSLRPLVRSRTSSLCGAPEPSTSNWRRVIDPSPPHSVPAFKSSESPLSILTAYVEQKPSCSSTTEVSDSPNVSGYDKDKVPPTVKEYREATRRILEERVKEMWNRMFDEMKSLTISEMKPKHGNASPASIYPKMDWQTIGRRIKLRLQKEKRNEMNKRKAQSSSAKMEKVSKKEDPVPSTSKSNKNERGSNSCRENPIVEKKVKKEVVGRERSDSVRRDGGNRKNSESDHQKASKKGKRDDSKTSETRNRGDEAGPSSEFVRSQKTTTKRPREVKEEPRENEYEVINMSVANGQLPGWTHPPPATNGCSCSRNCGESCTYRLLRVQCQPNCSAVGCTNKLFRDVSVENLFVERIREREVIRSKVKRGKGEFIAEFAGEVISATEMSRRLTISGSEKTRAVVLSPRLFVDATRKGNVTRFLTHSCNPNAELQIWLVGGRLRIGIFAKNEISEQTDITVDLRQRLPKGFSCVCGECDGDWIAPARYPIIARAPDMSIQEERTVRKHNIFLPRNRANTIDHAAKAPGHASRLMQPERIGRSSPHAMRLVLRLVSRRVRRPDGTLPRHALQGYTGCIRALRSRNVDLFNEAVQKWINTLDSGELTQLYSMLHSRYLTPKKEVDVEKKKKELEEMREKERRRRENAKNGVMSGHADLAYLESQHPIGSYQPDVTWPKGSARVEDDAVRCICGAFEEDGDMLQCDGCHFWLHNDCVGMGDRVDGEYKCPFCIGRIPIERGPSTDVLLKTPPDFRLEGCTYYKSLLNQYDLQIRLNETVYVEKLKGDEHKKALKRSLESEGEPTKKKKKREVLPTRLFSRSDVRIMRVERLFSTPDGRRFLFGFYYARPHETFCDPSKIFHRREVFATPLYDTLPLDSVAGRCMVLNGNAWTTGRPLVPLYKEEDVLLCEYQIGRNQRTFEKIPQKNNFFVNTQPYVFQAFEEPKTIRRDFTPFVLLPSASTSSSTSTSPQQTEFEQKEVQSERLNRLVEKLRKKAETASDL